MNDVNRDLLVLSDTAHFSPEQLERELAFLNTLLFHIENWETFSIANEVIDINRRRIVRDSFLIQKILTKKEVKAFVFTCNKN
ncbi:MAG: hypothetical protein JWQ30_865 [Sediminibacterium sp.]|nr:hypothetical protein [Sediminibacterium sp.]